MFDAINSCNRGQYLKATDHKPTLKSSPVVSNPRRRVLIVRKRQQVSRCHWIYYIPIPSCMQSNYLHGMYPRMYDRKNIQNRDWVEPIDEKISEAIETDPRNKEWVRIGS